MRNWTKFLRDLLKWLKEMQKMDEIKRQRGAEVGPG